MGGGELVEKHPGVENSKLKKLLRLSPSLEIRSTPPPGGTVIVAATFPVHLAKRSIDY